MLCIHLLQESQGANCVQTQTARPSVGHATFEIQSGGYMSLFFDTLSGLHKENILIHSEKGPFVIQIVQVLLQDQQNPSVVDMAMKIFARLETCLAAGTKHRLPSSIQKKIWSSFHVARFDETVIKAWDTHIMKLKLPEVLQCYTSVAFQIIFDRLMKALIKEQKTNLSTSSEPKEIPILGHREKNVIHYMSGFVAVRLIKRYSRHTTNPKLKRKRQLFLGVLKNMRAEEQPYCLDSCEDYTRIWTEQIDRGGLYKINPKV